VPALHIVDVCSALKSGPDTQFDFLADICAADNGVEEEPRFEVNYHLFSTRKHHRLRLKSYAERKQRARSDSDRRLAHGKLA